MGGKTLCHDDTQVHLNGVASGKNADMFMDVALNSIDKTIEPMGLHDSAKSFDYFNDDQSIGFENLLPDSDLNKLVDLNMVDISDKCTECIDDCTFSKSQGFVVENEHPDGTATGTRWDTEGYADCPGCER